MNAEQVSNVKHALKNGNRFYTAANDPSWMELVEKGYATKHPGWEESQAYFRVTETGERMYHEWRMADNDGRT